jgi:hypothetical protein
MNTTLRRVLGFSGCYLSAAVVAAIATGNGEFVFYIVVMFVLLGAALLVHRKVGLSPLVLWGLSFWGLVHMAGGLVPVPESWPINGEIRVLYSWWLIPDYLKFDQLVHAYGFGITAVMCWESFRWILSQQTGKPINAIQPTPGILTLSAAAGMGFGALNEVVEFTATLLIPGTNVGGYVNTGWDLVSNLVGVTLAAFFIHLFCAAKSSES